MGETNPLEHQIDIFGTESLNYINTTFYISNLYTMSNPEDPFNYSRIVVWVQTDGHIDISKRSADVQSLLNN